MRDGFNVKGLDQQSIIDGVVKGTELPSKPLAEYTKSQLVRLCVLLITLIQELILSKVGVPLRFMRKIVCRLRLGEVSRQ